MKRYFYFFNVFPFTEKPRINISVNEYHSFFRGNEFSPKEYEFILKKIKQFAIKEHNANSH